MAVALEVAIRRVADGEVRHYHYEVDPKYLDGQPFWWGDGNAACDCNRGQFFDEAGGVELDDDAEEARPCGDSAYEVDWLKVVPTGEVIYSDNA